MKVLVCVSALLALVSGEADADADPYYSNGYGGFNPSRYLSGPLSVSRYVAPITGGASFSGTLTSGPSSANGDTSGSYSIKTSDGYNGKGTFSMNAITGTMTALTLGGQSLINSSSGGLRVAPPGHPGHPGPFSVSWSVKHTGNGDVSGTFSVAHQRGNADSGTFNFNTLNGSVGKVSYNGQDISNVFGSTNHFG